MDFPVFPMDNSCYLELFLLPPSSFPFSIFNKLTSISSPPWVNTTFSSCVYFTKFHLDYPIQVLLRRRFHFPPIQRVGAGGVQLLGVRVMCTFCAHCARFACTVHGLRGSVQECSWLGALCVHTSVPCAQLCASCTAVCFVHSFSTALCFSSGVLLLHAHLAVHQLRLWCEYWRRLELGEEKAFTGCSEGLGAEGALFKAGLAHFGIFCLHCWGGFAPFEPNSAHFGRVWAHFWATVAKSLASGNGAQGKASGITVFLTQAITQLGFCHFSGPSSWQFFSSSLVTLSLTSMWPAAPKADINFFTVAPSPTVSNWGSTIN